MDSSFSYSKLKSVDIESDDSNSIYPIKPTDVAHKPIVVYPRRQRSCLKICLCCTLILVLVFITVPLCLIGGVYMWMAGHVKEWTVTEPIELPVDIVPQEELDIFVDRAKLFFDLVQTGQVPGDLVVMARDLNGFASVSDFLRGNAFATMKENEATVTLSLPMDGFPGGKGRFLVGTETISWNPETSVLHARMASPTQNRGGSVEDEIIVYYDFKFHLSLMDDGKWNLMILSGQFFAWEVPEDFIEEHQNLLEDLYNCDPRSDEDCKHAKALLEGISDISLEKYRVVFHGRTNAKAMISSEEFSYDEDEDSSASSSSSSSSSSSDSESESESASWDGNYRRALQSLDTVVGAKYESSWKVRVLRRLAPLF